MPIPPSAATPPPTTPARMDSTSTDAHGLEDAGWTASDTDWSDQQRALIAGDLGDALYRVESFSESMAVMRSMVQSHQPATLVVMDATHPEQTEPLAHFTACIASIDEANHSLAIEVPAQTISHIHATAPHTSTAAPASTTATATPNPTPTPLATNPLGHGNALRGAVVVDGVTMTFDAETLGATPPSAEQRGWMLHARLPFRLYRIQRRDSFRVPLASTAGVLITLTPGQPALGHLKALDLSCGGTSLVVRAPLDTVYQGKRFTQATLQLHTQPGSPQFAVNMLVRHVHIVPPALGQLLSDASPLAKPGTHAVIGNGAGAAAGTNYAVASNHRAQQPRPPSTAKTEAAPTPPQPPIPWLQLGIAFERMPTALERELSKRINELAVSLVSGQ